MLNDKVIVITGGAGLLGQAFVEAIAKSGGTAVIADLDVATAVSVKDRLASSEGGLIIDTVALDITSAESVDAAIKAVSEKYGRVDALINNAYPRNKNYGRHFFDVEYDDFCTNLNMNLGGYFLTSQKFARYFVQQGHGNIVNISSIYGVIAPKFDIYDDTKMTMPVEYAAIKSGLIHLTKYMAGYLKGKNIRVNAISPGGIFDHQPEDFLTSYNDHCLNKGMLDPQDLCGTLLYLLSDHSSFVNGQNLVVDDGFTLS
ncbi:MAG: oxidoreductase [Halopseudomonas sp.]